MECACERWRFGGHSVHSVGLLEFVRGGPKWSWAIFVHGLRPVQRFTIRFHGQSSEWCGEFLLKHVVDVSAGIGAG